MIEVRGAKEKDINDMLALIREKAAFDECLDSFKSNFDDIYTAFFSEKPNAKAIVATNSGKVVGIATYYQIYSTFIAKKGIWLDDLFVYEEFRKYGVGKALISELGTIAKREGCGRIDWIVARDNQNGRGFYESLGAKIFEEVRHSRLDEQAIEKLAKNNA